MNTGQVATGFIKGTAAAVNVTLGWIPEYVQIINLTDGDSMWINHLARVMLFTGGGTAEIKAGDKLHGNTSDAVGIIRQVILDSGTWAGGDAAGWFIFQHDTVVGTFESETGYREGIDADGDDGATIALDNTDGIDIDDAVAATTTGATNIIAYVGTRGGNAKGFTMGATIGEDGDLMGYLAFRGDHQFDQTS